MGTELSTSMASMASMASFGDTNGPINTPKRAPRRTKVGMSVQRCAGA